MTYNFDPDRWYENHRARLTAHRQKYSESEYQAALKDLERRYEALVVRLDGTYTLLGDPPKTTE